MSPQKSVLITGCSGGGIGDALAKEFHHQGLRVFATARNLDKIQHLKEMGMNIVQLDVEDKTSIEKAAAEVEKLTGGSLDILANNAGIGYQASLMDTDLGAGKKVFNVNLFGVVAVTQAFVRQIIAAKGRIVNIGSVGGKVPVPFQGMYVASKAALQSVTDVMRLELAPFGIKVIHVISGGVNTAWLEHCANYDLPATSIYASVRDDIEPAVRGDISRKNLTYPLNKFAAEVVRNTLSPRPSVQYWVGNRAFSIWILITFFWHTFGDAVTANMYGLAAASSKLINFERRK